MSNRTAPAAAGTTTGRGVPSARLRTIPLRQRNYVRAGGLSFEKDTKAHQMRRIALDDTTVEILSEHRKRHEDLAGQLEITARDDAFLFSHKPARDVPYDPDGVSHRYIAMYASCASTAPARPAPLLRDRASLRGR